MCGRGRAKRRLLFEGLKMKQITAPTLIMTGDEDWPCIEPAVPMKKNIATAGLVRDARRRPHHSQIRQCSTRISPNCLLRMPARGRCAILPATVSAILGRGDQILRLFPRKGSVSSFLDFGSPPSRGRVVRSRVIPAINQQVGAGHEALCVARQNTAAAAISSGCPSRPSRFGPGGAARFPCRRSGAPAARSRPRPARAC